MLRVGRDLSLPVCVLAHAIQTHRSGHGRVRIFVGPKVGGVVRYFCGARGEKASQGDATMPKMST